MKKSLFFLFISFTWITTQAQYEQIKGQPCYFERYTVGDLECSVNPADVEKTTLSGDSIFTIFDDNNDTIIHLIPDSESLDDGIFEGEAAIGTKYIGYNGSEISSLYYTLISDGFIDTYKDDQITETEYFNINSFNNETFYMEETSSGTKFIINIESGNSSEITYSTISNLKPETCTTPELELFYSDSLFYDNEGILTKRKRNNIFGDDLFDFQSHYQYQGDGDIEKYYQIDYDGDTTQLEVRYFNDLDQAYKIERRTSYYLSIYNLTYNEYDQITETEYKYVQLSSEDTINSTHEKNTFDNSGNWQSYIKTDQYGDTTIQKYVTEVLGNNTFKFEEITYSWFFDSKDTTYYKKQYVDNYFEEFELEYTTKEIEIFDANGTLLSSGKNEFNEFGQLTYSEGLDHEVFPIAKLQSDSIIYDYSSDEELLKRTIYRYNTSDNQYHLNSENIYFCHGETISPVAVNEKIDFEFELFPNPTSDMIFIQSNEDNIKLETYSMEGQLVKESNSSQIDVSDLKNGIYILQVTAGGLTKSVKIVKN